MRRKNYSKFFYSLKSIFYSLGEKFIKYSYVNLMIITHLYYFFNDSNTYFSCKKQKFDSNLLPNQLECY